MDSNQTEPIDPALSDEVLILDPTRPEITHEYLAEQAKKFRISLQQSLAISVRNIMTNKWLETYIFGDYSTAPEPSTAPKEADKNKPECINSQFTRAIMLLIYIRDKLGWPNDLNEPMHETALLLKDHPLLTTLLDADRDVLLVTLNAVAQVMMVAMFQSIADINATLNAQITPEQTIELMATISKYTHCPGEDYNANQIAKTMAELVYDQINESTKAEIAEEEEKQRLAEEKRLAIEATSKKLEEIIRQLAELNATGQTYKVTVHQTDDSDSD